MAITPEKAGTSQQKPTSSNTVYNYIDFIKIDGADKVFTGCNNESPAESSWQNLQPPVSIDEFHLTRLKKYYLAGLCQAVPLPWLPTRAWSVHEIYTKLSLHDSDEKRKFGVEELFDHAKERFSEEGIYRILIEGDAGFGKSTLVLKIISDWSKSDSKVPANYTSPFVLLLAVKLSSVGEDGDIRSYMEKTYTKEIENMNRRLRDVLERKGAEKVLILLDGYDEANAKTQKEVRQIMEREMLSQSHVVLTSRFGYVPDDTKCKALHVKVNGFDKEQVYDTVLDFFVRAGRVTEGGFSRYLESSAKNKLLGQSCVDNGLDDSDSDDGLDDSDSDDGLDDSDSDDGLDDSDSDDELGQEVTAAEKRRSLEQLTQFMGIILNKSPYKELARCPLYCIMLCCLVIARPNSELPSTIPGLYFALINRNLYLAARKNAKAAGKISKWNWETLENRIHENHERYLQKFGRLCAKGLKNRSLSFTLFDITGNEIEAEPTNVKVTQLIEAGVLVQDLTKLNTYEDILRYEVPHRTMAEFLAAYYLSAKTKQTFWFRLFGFAEETNSCQHGSLNPIVLVKNYSAEIKESGILMDAFRPLIAILNSVYILPLRRCFCSIAACQELAATGTLAKYYGAPSSKQLIRIEILGFYRNDNLSFIDVIVNTSEPSLIVLQLFEEFCEVRAGNGNARLSSAKMDFPVPPHVKIHHKFEKVIDHKPWYHKFVKLHFIFKCWEFEVEDTIGRDGTNNQFEFIARNIYELSDSCPVHLSFANASDVRFIVIPPPLKYFFREIFSFLGLLYPVFVFGIVCLVYFTDLRIVTTLLKNFS